MAALVQTYPQQSTVTMLQSRPTSPGGFSPLQSQPHSGLRTSSPRYHSPSNSGSQRGTPSHGLVAPYAFTSTPQLANSSSSPRQYPSLPVKSENRASAAPVLPPLQLSPPLGGSLMSIQPRYSTSPSMSTLSTTGSTQPIHSNMEDTSTSSTLAMTDSSSQPGSYLGISLSGSNSSIASSSSAKPSPDRYRRPIRRVDSGESGQNRANYTSAAPSGSGMATVGHLYTHPNQTSSSPSFQTYQSLQGTPKNAGDQTRKCAVDDLSLARPSNAEVAKRYRRRSLGSLEPAESNSASDSESFTSHPSTVFIQSPLQQIQSQDPRQTHQPTSSHPHNGSSDSLPSNRSARSSRPSSSGNEATTRTSTTNTISVLTASKQEMKLLSMPPRLIEPNKRSTNPSPLSRPIDMSIDSAKSPPSTPKTAPKPATIGSPERGVVESPAAQHLAAVSQKDAKKTKSKLRRAFSFGSSAELRKATAQNNLERSTLERVTLERSTITDPRSKRNSKYEDEMEPEQARIAEKQEAGGLGTSIYSGQGHFFTGSTDNLSISSTASSASIMLRKMGKGMKKSTRSLVGLFRPKSVIGVPAADGPVNQASAAEVSMVTVEAEREKVNVNLDPHDQAGGGTGFPKLGRNSIDAKKNSGDSSRPSDDSRSRRSIVGGERERSEVLAAVKKGILKRTDSNQSSPITRPLDWKLLDSGLPHIPHVNDSPHSSAPSTPADDQPPRSGHRRTDSITIEGDSEDYFAAVTRFVNPEPKNGLMTPNGSITRNISFSPRIQFHDTWPSGEYDRRGEIATCNRLTPMLAQQIKEELNTFKMEMEVHESSKVYTHFF